MNDLEPRGDPFAHLKQRARERADRTVERLRIGIAALEATGQKITTESLKQVTRDLEPGFAGLSFQVIRRNPRAYELYREAADAFTAQTMPDKKPARKRRRGTRAGSRRTPRSSYDPLQRLEQRDLVRRIRTLEQDLENERQQRGALAYDQQAIRARILRLERRKSFCSRPNQAAMFEAEGLLSSVLQNVASLLRDNASVPRDPRRGTAYNWGRRSTLRD